MRWDPRCRPAPPLPRVGAAASGGSAGPLPGRAQARPGFVGRIQGLAWEEEKTHKAAETRRGAASQGNALFFYKNHPPWPISEPPGTAGPGPHPARPRRPAEHRALPRRPPALPRASFPGLPEPRYPGPAAGVVVPALPPRSPAAAPGAGCRASGCLPKFGCVTWRGSLCYCALKWREEPDTGEFDIYLSISVSV